MGHAVFHPELHETAGGWRVKSILSYRLILSVHARADIGEMPPERIGDRTLRIVVFLDSLSGPPVPLSPVTHYGGGEDLLQRRPVRILLAPRDLRQVFMFSQAIH